MSVKSYLRDKQNNILDPITYNIISEDRVVDFTEDNVFWYFDIDTLYRSSQENKGELINPYNRKPLPLEIIKKVEAYKAKTEVKIKVFSSGISTLTTQTYAFPYYKEFADAIVYIVSKSAANAIGCDFSTFASRELVNKKTGVSIYVYQETTPMSVIGNCEWYFDTFPNFNRQISCLVSLGNYCAKKKNDDYDDYHLLYNSCRQLTRPVINKDIVIRFF